VKVATRGSKRDSALGVEASVVRPGVGGKAMTVEGGFMTQFWPGNFMLSENTSREISARPSGGAMAHSGSVALTAGLAEARV
jgi:hypothetical protein